MECDTVGCIMRSGIAKAGEREHVQPSPIKVTGHTSNRIRILEHCLYDCVLLFLAQLLISLELAMEMGD